jgi:dephospho-CoA kinase
MRLAVIGPQNTGKTTFIKDFVKAFPHYKTPKETYRDVVEKGGLKINQQTGEKSQLAIRNFVFNQIKTFQGENVIFDRSLLDVYIYSLAGHMLDNIRKSFVDETKKIMHLSLAHIDRLILIPTAVGVELVSDQLRDTDKLYVDHINKLFIEEIIEFARTNPTPIWVISGDRETRIKLIGEKLNS